MRPLYGQSVKRFAKWDGSQAAQFEEGEIFDAISDSLLYHGDPSSALRQLMADGLELPDGRSLVGLREILERLRQERSDILNRFDPSGKSSEIRDRIEREVIDVERQQLDQLVDASKGEISKSDEDKFFEGNMELDNVGSTLPSIFESLSGYEFESDAARENFEKIVEELRQEVLDNFFQGTKQSLESLSGGNKESYREMMSAMNDLIESHLRGEDTEESFANFKEKYGDSIPPGIENTQELLDFLVEQMAAAQLAFGALSAEQQGQLSELFSMMMNDMDLAWQMNRFASALSPLVDPSQLNSMRFRGNQSMSMGEASEAMSSLSDIDSIESFLRSATSPSDLSKIDLDAVEKLLGKDSANSIRRLSEIVAELEKAGLIGREGATLELTPAGMRKIGAKVLRDLFRNLDKSRFGAHVSRGSGVGVDRNYDTKPYEFGDPLEIDLNATLKNAILRGGGGVPIKLSVEDFEVELKERSVTASTVLLLDLSLSMPLRDNFLAAKKVAMALATLIRTSYPRDYLGIVGFSEAAHEIKINDLPTVAWDYVYGTNMEDAMRKARAMLAGKSGTKQIIMVTDGEPTAHILEDGTPFFSYPPAYETIEATFAEVRRCTRENLLITSFVLDADDRLMSFMNKLSSINGGKNYFCNPDNLGDFVIVDFMNRRSDLR
jgi:uncharacterized protein with von Willebrand factor type A (vWA) domain